MIEICKQLHLVFKSYGSREKKIMIRYRKENKKFLYFDFDFVYSKNVYFTFNRFALKHDILNRFFSKIRILL
jgi:hypothetical protein